MHLIHMTGHLIRRLNQQSTHVFQSQIQAAGFDLTSVQFAALDTIEKKPGIDQSSVAAAISFDRATLGSVIDHLEFKGWIVRQVSPQDRRARLLSLTFEGKQVLAACRPVVEALQSAILATLSYKRKPPFWRFPKKRFG